MNNDPKQEPKQKPEPIPDWIIESADKTNATVVEVDIVTGKVINDYNCQ